MSTVYFSFDVGTNRPVAVKLLADHLAHSREFVNRFYREARLSRLLSHPNLVQGLAAGYDPAAGKHYLVLEYVDGPTAHAALAARGPFPVGVAVRIGIDIGRALAFLHARQYVHRDVKPDNVLLHPSGVAKLADLGLAKRLNDDTQLTSASQGVGTTYYMAYEQALNANLVDGRSDVFALGATLYHLLTGDVPFPGATHEEVSRGKASDEFRPPDRINPGVPKLLSGIIAATLARDPRERFQSAGELAAALEATGLATPIPPLLLSGAAEPGHADAPTRADLKALGPGKSVPSPAPPTESFNPAQVRAAAAVPVAAPAGNKLWLWAAVGVLAAVGIVGAILSKGVGGMRRTLPTAPAERAPVGTPDLPHLPPPAGGPSTPRIQ
jgi:serine/threonine-protein kinase